MPVREATGTLTFRLDSRPYWWCVATGLAVYWAVVVLVVAFAVEDSAGLWPGLVGAVLAVTGMVGVARLLAWHVRRVVIDGGTVTVVTVIDTSEFPVSGITRISARRGRRARAKLWFDGGAAVVSRTPFASDRPADVVQALIELRPDVPVSGSWSAPVPPPAGPPQYSPDGRWWWNSSEWLPVPPTRPWAVRRRRWGLVAGTGIFVYLAIALAIWRVFWLADAGYRHLAANAVATTAHVTVDATTYSHHGAFCYSYSVGEPTYQTYSGCGRDEHPDPVSWPAVGTPIAAIYDRQHPDVSCLCTTDYLMWDQKVNEVAWAIGLTGILAFAVLAYVVFDVLNGYRSRSVYALVAWLR